MRKFSGYPVLKSEMFVSAIGCVKRTKSSPYSSGICQWLYKTGVCKYF